MAPDLLLLGTFCLITHYATFADALLWTVCAHSFPVWSGGTHGPTAELVTRLRPLLKRHGAHYMSGHDHVSSFHDEGLGPVFVVAGNGDNCCYNASHAPALPENSTKFGAHTLLVLLSLTTILPSCRALSAHFASRGICQATGAADSARKARTARSVPTRRTALRLRRSTLGWTGCPCST